MMNLRNRMASPTVCTHPPCARSATSSTKVFQTHSRSVVANVRSISRAFWTTRKNTDTSRCCRMHVHAFRCAVGDGPLQNYPDDVAEPKDFAVDAARGGCDTGKEGDNRACGMWRYRPSCALRPPSSDYGGGFSLSADSTCIWHLDALVAGRRSCRQLRRFPFPTMRCPHSRRACSAVCRSKSS